MFAIASPPGAEILAQSQPTCSEHLTAPLPQPSGFIKWAPKAAGLVLGAANGVLLTLLSYQLLPPALAKWLPLFNEIANVASTSTGKSWLYSGSRKRIIDGVALGGIAGQALQAGAEHGPLVGALNFGVSVGLTYWFPNKYFHTIMRGIPGRLPKPLQKPATHPLGQGVIGISMIMILEQLLEHSQQLVARLPAIFGQARFAPARSIAVADTKPTTEPRHALALFILDATLKAPNPALQERVLLFLASPGRDGQLFSSQSVVTIDDLEREGPVQTKLFEKIDGDALQLVLRPKEWSELRQRVEALKLHRP